MHLPTPNPADQYKESPYAYLFEDDSKQCAPSQEILPAVKPAMVDRLEEETVTERALTIGQSTVEEDFNQALNDEGMDTRWEVRKLKSISEAMTYTRLWDMVEDYPSQLWAMKLIMKARWHLNEKIDNSGVQLIERIFRKSLQTSSR